MSKNDTLLVLLKAQDKYISKHIEADAEAY